MTEQEVARVPRNERCLCCRTRAKSIVGIDIARAVLSRLKEMGVLKSSEREKALSEIAETDAGKGLI